MTIVLVVLLVFVFLFATTQNSSSTSKPPAIPIPEGWKLVWHDEFDGPEIDPKNWTYDTGGDGWGNQEWEYYTNRPENARVENGTLIIEARKELFSGRSYTSARLKTQGLQEWAYGRIEARIKIPRGQGIWPAFWMLGSDLNQVSWPLAGEIDIMENIGSEPGTVHGTLHGPGYSGGGGITARFSSEDVILSDDFHVYAVEWEAGQICWYLDDTLYQTLTPADLRGQCTTIPFS